MLFALLFIGAKGFEPSTSATRTQRSTKLSHAPARVVYYHGTESGATILTVPFCTMNTPNENGPYVIGIDAGGTSVRVALANAQTGQVEKEATGAALPDGGPSAMMSLWEQVTKATSGETFSVVGVCAGITKWTRAGVRSQWEAYLHEAFPYAHVSVVPDYVTAFHGAVPTGIGAVVIAGTGSVVYGANANGGAVRVGGARLGLWRRRKRGMAHDRSHQAHSAGVGRTGTTIALNADRLRRAGYAKP